MPLITPSFNFTDGTHLRVYNVGAGYTHALCDASFLTTYDLTAKRPNNRPCFMWGDGYGQWRADGYPMTFNVAPQVSIDFCDRCMIRHSLIVANSIPIGWPHGCVI